MGYVTSPFLEDKLKIIDNMLNKGNIYVALLLSFDEDKVVPVLNSLSTMP
jgi:hypothetical protein